MANRLAEAVTAYQQAQAEVATAQTAVVAAQQTAVQARQHATEAREALATEIRAAHADGMRVVDLMRMTGYSREGIRKILGLTSPSDEP